MMDFTQGFEEFRVPAEMKQKTRPGVTSIEQLIREGRKKDAELKKLADTRDRIQRESLEAAVDEDDAMPDLGAEVEAATAAAAAAEDRPEPPATEQCLFPEHAEAVAQPQLAGSEARAAAESASTLAANASTDNAALDRQDAIRELLVHRVLADHCALTGSCPAGVAQELFRLMTACADFTVAEASFQTLVSLMGHRTSLSDFADPSSVDPAGISEFEGPQRDCAFGWLPGDEQLLSVLHTFGYRSPGPAGDAKPLKVSPRKQKASASGGKRVHAESPHGDCGAAVLLRLRLLLRFLPHLCAYDQERGSKRRGGLRPAGLRTLAAALLRLQLDPLAQKLSNELRVAVAALLRAFPSEKDWRAALPNVAADAASLGSSHRAQVAVLGALPADTPRGAQLQAALATLLLQRLVPPMPKVPPTHPSWRLLRHKYNLPEYDESAAVHLPAMAAPEVSLLDIDAQAVVKGLWWQQHVEETKRAAQAAYKGTANFDVWELDSAVQAADVLLWPDTLALTTRVNAENERDGDHTRLKYIKGVGWKSTLTTLHNELRRVTGAWQMPALRLAGLVECLMQRNRLATQPTLG